MTSNRKLLDDININMSTQGFTPEEKMDNYS